MLRQILEDYRKQQFNKDKGDAFERLVCAWLKCDPQYQSIFLMYGFGKTGPNARNRDTRFPIRVLTL